MSLPYRILLEAAGDLEEAADWYERQGVAVRQRFGAAVKQTLESIVKNPLLHAPLREDVRAKRVNNFPYYIYYRVRKGYITILAIQHGSRDWSNWESRM